MNVNSLQDGTTDALPDSHNDIKEFAMHLVIVESQIDFVLPGESNVVDVARAANGDYLDILLKEELRVTRRPCYQGLSFSFSTCWFSDKGPIVDEDQRSGRHRFQLSNTVGFDSRLSALDHAEHVVMKSCLTLFPPQ